MLTLTLVLVTSSVLLWLWRSETHACREAARTPVRMSRPEYLSQLRADAEWDAHRLHGGAGGWATGDDLYRFPAAEAREILRVLETVDPADADQVAMLADRYGVRDPRDVYAMRYHPAILTD